MRISSGLEKKKRGRGRRGERGSFVAASRTKRKGTSGALFEIGGSSGGEPDEEGAAESGGEKGYLSCLEKRSKKRAIVWKRKRGKHMTSGFL